MNLATPPSQPQPPSKGQRPISARIGVLMTLAAIVLLGHVLLTGAVLGEMQDINPSRAGIKRMEATYVSEIKLTQPPAAPPAPAVVRPAEAANKAVAQAKTKKPKLPKVAKAPSQPDEAASSPEVLAEAASAVDVAQAPSAPASTPASPPASAPATAKAEPPSSPVAAASVPSMGASGPNSGRAFVWPVATKVTYKMEGYFRGPVSGSAAVEWVRKDDRYQVHIDAGIPPLFSWRLSSEGEIQPQGLYPRLYQGAKRRLVKLDEVEVSHEDGKHYPRPPAVQDMASFMIQLAYQFTLKPDLLKPGHTFEMSLVSERKLEQIAFDVVGEDVVRTPIGDVPTVHVRPRKTVVDGGAIPADVWFAPGLQYLPVRIYLKMGDDVYMDLQMSRAPQQAPGEGASDSTNAPAKSR